MFNNFFLLLFSSLPALCSFLKIMVLNIDRTREQGDALTHLWYKIHLRYGSVPYEWTIKRSYKDIFALHSRLAVVYVSKGLVTKLPAPPNILFANKRGRLHHLLSSRKSNLTIL